jgi:hypothetical protein
MQSRDKTAICLDKRLSPSSTENSPRCLSQLRETRGATILNAAACRETLTFKLPLRGKYLRDASWPTNHGQLLHRLTPTCYLVVAVSSSEIIPPILK